MSTARTSPRCEAKQRRGRIRRCQPPDPTGAARGAIRPWARLARGSGRLEQSPAERLADLGGSVAVLDHQAGYAVLLAEGSEPLGHVMLDEALENEHEVDAAVADPLLERVEHGGLGVL